MTYFARDTIVGVTVLAKTVAPKVSFFKPLHLLIRALAYQVPVLLICPLALPKVLSLLLISHNLVDLNKPLGHVQGK